MFKVGDVVLVNCPAFKLSSSPFLAKIVAPDETHGYDWRIVQGYKRLNDIIEFAEPKAEMKNNFPFKESELTGVNV